MDDRVNDNFSKEIDARLTVEELIWEIKTTIEDLKEKKDEQSKYDYENYQYLLLRLREIRNELKNFEEENNIFFDSYNYSDDDEY
jgi:hypothetical protein